MGGPPRRPGPPQPMSRRRRWPVSALVAALVAAVAVGCVVAAAWLVWATPGDGVMMQSRGGMPWSTGRSVAVTGTLASAPLRPGDEVLAVDGRDIHEWAGYLVSHPAGIRPWRPGQTVVYRVVRDGAVRQIRVLVRQPVQSAGNWPWSEIAIRVLALLVTGFVFLRRPETPAARAGLLFAAGYALNLSFPAFTLQVHPLLGPIGAIPYLMAVVGGLLWTSAVLHFALVFPEPRLVARHRWVVPLVYGLPLGMFGAYLALIADGAPTTGVRAIHFEGRFHLMGYLYPLAIVLAFAWGYRATSDPLMRQRMRWIAATVSAALVLEVCLWTVPGRLTGRPLLPGELEPLLTLAGLVAIAAAILRYRAFDIEILVNRTLVWASLTACVAVVYGGTLLLLALLLQTQTRQRFVLTLLATGLVAVCLQPLRGRLQRAVNRWMYGDRDDPAAVLARLGNQLQAAGPAEAALDGLVATVGQAMKLRYVAIELDRLSGPEVAATWGQPGDPLVSLPLVHDGEMAGRMIVASGAQSGTLRPRDRRLLEVLAQQAGAAVHAARLAAELERSRGELEDAHHRLVRARAEERRRLRRDLHDGIGPLLAGMTLQVDAARNLLGREPAGSKALLGKVRRELELAVADVRNLVDALQPTPLDQLGLVPALQEAAARFSTAAAGPASADESLLAIVEAPDDLPRLPAAVELAAYRIATEALTNTAKHARARHCWIRLACNGALDLEVADDGIGVHHPSASGVGLHSMRERAAELGGSCTTEFLPGAGTRIRACLPIRQV